MYGHIVLSYYFILAFSYEVLPGYTSYGTNPQLNYNGDRMKFALGTVKDSYGAPSYLQIPIGPGAERLRVPKAFYHYSEQDTGMQSQWGLPDNGRLISTNSLIKNNRKEINGIYLPIPNMDPINLHFITQKTFEKGIDTAAYNNSPEGLLARAKRICMHADEDTCEKALLYYHRHKSEVLRKEKEPFHEQLLHLGDLSSDSRIRDREGTGMGVVVGLPGYEPLYVGAALDNKKDSEFGLRFIPPS